MKAEAAEKHSWAVSAEGYKQQWDARKTAAAAANDQEETEDENVVDAAAGPVDREARWLGLGQAMAG